jgi:multicomponent Na+:H+ antiporter subunit B
VSPRARRIVFAVAAAGLAALLVWALRGLPGFGRYPGPYGDYVNHSTVPQRHTTDAVSAVNFDYRGIDTVGEEFILFVAATGVAVLLRAQRDEKRASLPHEESERHRGTATSDAVRMFALASVGPLTVLGVYIVSHGQISPGGGFQGGVVLASAVVAVYLAGQYIAMSRAAPITATETVEALGAAGFVGVGLAGMASGGAFLTNLLPLGTPATIASGGTIALVSFAVGMEVVAGFVLIISEFLEQTLVVRGG